MRWKTNHKQRHWEAGPGPAGIAGPVVLNVSMNCKFFFFFFFVLVQWVQLLIVW